MTGRSVTLLADRGLRVVRGEGIRIDVYDATHDWGMGGRP